MAITRKREYIPVVVRYIGHYDIGTVCHLDTWVDLHKLDHCDLRFFLEGRNRPGDKQIFMK